MLESSPSSTPPANSGDTVDLKRLLEEQGDRPSSTSSPELRHELRQAFQACRQTTLALVEPFDWDVLCQQAHSDFSPAGWHLGHIAYTEALWVLQRLAGQPSLQPNYSRLFAADGLPKDQRQYLPDRDTIYSYLETVRHQVLDYLESETTPLQRQERLWWFLLQHESQHCETMALVLEMQKGDRSSQVSPMTLWPSIGRSDRGSGEATPPAPRDSAKDGMVYIPAGPFTMGSDATNALDNERPRHTAHVDAYWIDRYPVTCQDFRTFIEAGGYRQAEWWSEAGWQWLQRHPVGHPLYWSDDPVWDDHPVYGVSWYEADAYARFVGKRLPSEAEWEKAARWSPATGTCFTYPWGDAPPSAHHCNHHHRVGHTTPIDAYEAFASPSGCVDMLGNAWEWTASPFEGYAGFKPFPYVGYSKTYFDGCHYVLRGGSWATLSWTLRASLRNWYHPWIRQIFAGFRCTADVR